MLATAAKTKVESVEGISMVVRQEKLISIARRIFEEEQSLDIAIQRFKEEIVAFDYLIDGVIHAAAKEIMHTVQSESRAKIMGINKYQPKIYTKEMQDQITFSFGKFLDWPMMDGTRLGLANRQKVLSDATRYRKTAKGCTRNALFLEGIAAGLTEDQQVSDVFTNEELMELMNKAREIS